MSVSLIGIIFAVVGLLAMFRSRVASFGVLAVGSLFAAASAISLGPANITPGHFTLGLFVGAIVLRPNGVHNMIEALRPPRLGFLLLLLTAWSVLTAVLLPRLFQGLVYVIPLSTDALVYVPEPLRPASSNINQSIYFIANVLVFSGVVALCRTEEMMRRAVYVLLVACLINVAIAVVDSISYSVGMPQLLDFMRNADYGQAYEHVVAGMKRLTGSYPEASAFAGVGTGLFAFALRLWRGGVYPKLSGLAAATMLIAVLLAFSTTGYLALGLYLALIYSRALLGADGHMPKNREALVRRGVLIGMGPLAAVAVGVIVAIRPDLLDPVREVFDSSIATKLSSESGQERMEWNMSGLANFFETFGLGVGLGSVRVSSFLIGMLANVGVIGTILFIMFFSSLFLGTRPKRLPTDSDQIAAAGRSGCFALLISASVSASGIDLGLFFFIFAGLAAANVELISRARKKRPSEEMSARPNQSHEMSRNLHTPRFQD